MAYFAKRLSISPSANQIEGLSKKKFEKGMLFLLKGIPAEYFTRKEAKEAIQSARKIIEFCENHLS